MPSIGRLHVLTDFWLQQRLAHAELARRAIEGGADTIQFRQKHGHLRQQPPAARRVAAVCQAAHVPLIIDDHLPLALATGAQGVHLGQADFPVAEARRVLGPQAVIGATATTAAGACRAEADGASYIGFGPVFATRSKANPASVKGLRGLAAACAAVDIPVIAIAGITPEHVAAVIEAGAHGVAVLSHVAPADDPAAATSHFRQAIDEVLREDAMRET